MSRCCLICGNRFSSKTSEVCSPHCEEMDAQIRATMLLVTQERREEAIHNDADQKVTP
jgi:hypothetical protein